MSTSAPGPAGGRGNSLRLAVLLAVAAFFFLSTVNHLFSVNSEYYWHWQWQSISGSIVYPIVLPLAIPFFLGQMLVCAGRTRMPLALALVAASRIALMVGASAVQDTPPSVYRIAEVIKSRWSTSYFPEAIRLRQHGIGAGDLLARYPALIPNFYLHARQKPPGPVLFDTLMLHLFGGGDAGAMAIGFAIGAAAIVALLGVYWFIAHFTEDRDAAFLGASFMALCPSSILFFPDFDLCYPAFTAALAILWAMAIGCDRVRYSAALGFCYALMATMTYLVGAVAIFLAGYALWRYRTDRACTMGRIMRHLGVSLAAFLGFYVLAWVVLRFDGWAVFRACVAQERTIGYMLVHDFHYRPHHLPLTFFTDLYDFALGSGWISFLLVAYYFRRSFSSGLTKGGWIAVLCTAQFVMVAVMGLLPTETARTWIFMYPMLMTPIGLELRHWSYWERTWVFAALLLLTAAVTQSMVMLGAIP